MALQRDVRTPGMIGAEQREQNRRLGMILLAVLAALYVVATVGVLVLN